MADQVVLRDVIDSDLPVFFEQQRDPDAVRMAAFPAREEVAFHAHWAKVRADESVCIRTILFDGNVAGNIGCWDGEDERLVGYWIGKAYWGHGVATAALSQFLEQMPARPLAARVVPHNVGSIRVLEKCGFTLTGRGRGAAAIGGEEVEELIYRVT